MYQFELFIKIHTPGPSTHCPHVVISARHGQPLQLQPRTWLLLSTTLLSVHENIGRVEVLDIGSSTSGFFDLFLI
jgi:predicted rRNA methylase YqxC with S4 and FtsJ domains